MARAGRRRVVCAPHAVRLQRNAIGTKIACDFEALHDATPLLVGSHRSRHRRRRILRLGRPRRRLGRRVDPRPQPGGEVGLHGAAREERAGKGIERGAAALDEERRLLDADGNARLGRDDLMATKDKSLEELQTQANKRLNLSRQMSVGDRMVT